MIHYVADYSDVVKNVGAHVGLKIDGRGPGAARLPGIAKDVVLENDVSAVGHRQVLRCDMGKQAVGNQHPIGKISVGGPSSCLNANASCGIDPHILNRAINEVPKTDCLWGGREMWVCALYLEAGDVNVPVTEVIISMVVEWDDDGPTPHGG